MTITILLTTGNYGFRLFDVVSITLQLTYVGKSNFLLLFLLSDFDFYVIDNLRLILKSILEMDIALKEVQNDHLTWHQRVQDVLKMDLLIQMKSMKPSKGCLVHRRYLRTYVHGVANRLGLSVSPINISLAPFRNQVYA
jgi:hypothetical protein